MATEDEQLDAAAALPPEELSQALSDEIAQKWDPERILKMITRRAGRGDSLDASLRSRYEARLGVDLSHVRVYTGELAEEINKAHNAHALTIGGTGMIIMGGTADKSMATPAGQALLAHELTHVAQAKRGVHLKSAAGDMPFAEEHEAEAEAMEASVAAEEAGGGAQQQEAGGKEKDAEKLYAAVLARILDMFGEAGRVMLVRGGMLPRRP